MRFLLPLLLSAATALAVPVKNSSEVPVWNTEVTLPKTDLSNTSPTADESFPLLELHDDVIDNIIPRLGLRDQFKLYISSKTPVLPWSEKDAEFLKGLKSDQSALNKLRYYNYHEKADVLLLPKLVHTLKVGEEAVRQAVQFANEVIRITLQQGMKAEVLADLLEHEVTTMGYDSLLTSIQELMKDVKDELEKQINDETLAKYMYNYDDDWNMDNWVAVYLSNGEASDRRIFNSGPLRFLYRIRDFWKSLPLLDDRRNKFREQLGQSKRKKAYEVLEKLQEARATIPKTENYPKGFDIDDWMVQSLPAFLEMDAPTIQKAFQQARKEITFTHAVYQNRLSSVRKSIELKDDFYPIFVDTIIDTIYVKSEFDHAVLYTMHAGNFEMLNLLLQHQCIGGEYVQWMLTRAIWAMDAAAISFLLRDERIDKSKIEYGLIGISSQDISTLQAIFVESGKVTQDLIDSHIAQAEEDELNAAHIAQANI